MEHFKKLNAVDVNDHTEVKEQAGVKLTYLSWAWAWTEVKKVYPDAQYTIKKFDNLPYVLDPKTGYIVYTEVTIEGITHEMWLPVLDSNNRPMKDQPYDFITKSGKKTIQAATMFDINKTIMRCLTKNLGMFGLGLYIYAGEDLPETEDGQEKESKPKRAKVEQKDEQPNEPKLIHTCSKCGKEIDVKIYDYSVRKFGEPLCFSCQASNNMVEPEQNKPTIDPKEIKVGDTFEQTEQIEEKVEVNTDELPWASDEPQVTKKDTATILDELFYQQSMLRQTKINEFMLKKWGVNSIKDLNEDQAQYIISVLSPKKENE